jgi:hypothetical protein
VTSVDPRRVGAPAGTKAAGVALLSTLVVLAAVSAWLVRLPGPADQLTAAIAPVLVTVTPSDGAVQRPVQVRVDIGPALTSFSVLPGGVVTAVLVRPGAVVRTGSRVVEVDGIARLAAHTSRPFYRPLGRGDHGADVDQLGSLLSQLGLMHGPWLRGHPLDPAMATAVRHLALSIGAPQDGMFDPAWVVWLPEPELVVASVPAQVGGPVPGPGQPLLSYASTVRSASLAGFQPDSVLPVDDELELRGVGNEHLRLERGTVVLDALSRRVLTAAVASAQPGPGTDGDASAGTGTAARSVTVGAVRVTRWRDSVADLPVTGVVTRQDESTCVVVRSGDAWRPVTVTVLGSDPATLQAEVRGLSAGARLVANPEAAGLADRCRGVP